MAQEPGIYPIVVVPLGPDARRIHGDDTMDNSGIISRRNKDNHISTLDFLPFIRCDPQPIPRL
jgi:hypothetical protein